MTHIASKEYYYINSENAAEGTDEDFLYELNIPPSKHFTHVIVTKFSCSKSYYTVQSGYNQFNLTEGATTVTITVPPGFYTMQSFKTVLAALLTAESPTGWTYTITSPSSFSETQTYKYTYTVTGNGGSQPTFTTVAGNIIHEQLGLAQATSYTFVGDSLTSANVVWFQSEDSLYLHSDLVGAGQNSVLESISAAGVPDMGTIKYEAKYLDLTAKPLRTTSQNVYKFSLQNERGQVMGLNGRNINIELMLFAYNQGAQASPLPPGTPAPHEVKPKTLEEIKES